MNARRTGLLFLGIILLAFFLETGLAEPQASTPHSVDTATGQRESEPTSARAVPHVPGTMPGITYMLERRPGLEELAERFNSLLRQLSWLKFPATLGMAAPLQVVSSPPQSRVQFFEPDGYPPEPWSRLKEVTSTEYVYETAWGEYRFSKSLPVFRYFSHEEGYCRQFDAAGEACIDFYSNRPYNTTSAFWLLLGGSYGLPAGYTVWRADDTVFQTEARVARLTSTYAMRMTWDFMRSRYGPKITVEVWKVSGADRDFQVVWAGLARGVVDALGLDVGSLGGVNTPLGMRTGLRLSFQTGPPDTWRRYLRVDWGDEGPAETWLANVSVLGLSFYGWLVKYGLNDALIDPGVNVFGPSTVDPGFTTTGEKTLLTMSTTLAAGGRNVILAVFGRTSALDISAAGTFRVYKGASLLYETKITELLNKIGQSPKHVLVIAVDTAPAGNDSYSFKVNITTAGASTGSVHVQGIVIKTNDAEWAYNTTAVSITGGATATVTSMSTAFPAGSKVALVAVAYGSRASGTVDVFVGAGNVKLKSDATVLVSNQFSPGSGATDSPFWASLAYLDTPASGSQAYSLEITNGSSTTLNCFAEIVAFTVSDGVFLDTASVALSNGVQVTVGDLSTTLNGDVVAIGLAAAENTGGTSVNVFNANDVVLQLGNSATGQIGNLVGWHIRQTASHGRSGILPLFRLDTGVSNPSYQIKMTARAASINGEAKILAFTMPGGQQFTVNLSETLTASDTLAGIPNYVRVLAETLTASDSLERLQTLARTMSETMTASDTPARIPNYIRLITEALTASDTLARQQLLTRIITDTLTASDAITRIPTFVRNLSEALTASDSLARAAAYIRTIAETVGITSTAFPGAALITLAETILITESLQVLRTPFQIQAPISGPPVEITMPTPQQVFPVGLAVALGMVFVGAAYTLQRRRGMGAVMARARRRPELRGVRLPRVRFHGFRLGRPRWRRGLPGRRRHRDVMGE